MAIYIIIILLFLNTLRDESVSYSSIDTSQISKVCVTKHLRIQPHWQMESHQHCISRVLSSQVLVLSNLGVQVSVLAPVSPPRSAEPLARHHPASLAAGLGSPLQRGKPHPGSSAAPTAVSEFM